MRLARSSDGTSRLHWRAAFLFTAAEERLAAAGAASAALLETVDSFPKLPSLKEQQQPEPAPPPPPPAAAAAARRAESARAPAPEPPCTALGRERDMVTGRILFGSRPRSGRAREPDEEPAKPDREAWLKTSGRK